VEGDNPSALHDTFQANGQVGSLSSNNGDSLRRGGDLKPVLMDELV
jgi:hypothetical protein